MSEKIYMGNAKEVSFPNGGKKIDVMFKLDGLNQIWKDHGFTTEQGKKMIKLTVTRLKEPDKYNNTHTCYVDTFKPDPNYKSNLDSGGETF